LGTESKGGDYTIKPLPEKSVSLTDEAALEQLVKDWKEHPGIIEQINKNREVPITREVLIKEYQDKIGRYKKESK